MGTAIRVELWARRRRAEPSARIDAVMAEMHRIDRLMSPYKDDSELSRINRDAGQRAGAGGRRAVRADRALAAVLAHVRRRLRHHVCQRRPACTTTAHGVAPDAATLERARQAIGWRHLQLDANDRTIRFGRDGMRIDLGGFAKGHVVDTSIAILKRLGVAACGGGRRRRQPRDGRPARPPVVDRHPRSARCQAGGGGAAAAGHLDLHVGRLRALLRARRRAPPPPDRSEDRIVAARRAQRDDPRRRRPHQRSAVEVRVRDGARARHAADRVAARRRRRCRRRRRDLAFLVRAWRPRAAAPAATPGR